MVRALMLLPLLAGCEPEPPPSIDEVDWAAATGSAVVRLEGGVITLDGLHVGELREPGVLRQSRHRKLLKTLKLRSGQDPTSHDPPEAALLSQGWPARIEVGPELPWDDVYPLVATAAWAGFGPFELVRLVEPPVSLGPIATDTRQPAPWSGEPILGVSPVLDVTLLPEERCAQLRFEVRVEAEGEDPLAGLRQLPQVLRTIGSEPLVDCTVVFADQAVQQGSCLQAQGPPEVDAPAPPSIPPGKRGLPAVAFDSGVPGRVVLAPCKETPIAALLDSIANLTASGVTPVIALTKPAACEDVSCPEAEVSTLDGVQAAGARWLGEHHQPLR